MAKVSAFKNHPDLPQFRAGDAEQILGDQMPIVSLSPKGKIRLMKALKNKFGKAFKSNRTARKVMINFDEDFNDRREFLFLKGAARRG